MEPSSLNKVSLVSDLKRLVPVELATSTSSNLYKEKIT